MKYKLGDEVYLKGVITSISFCDEINYPYEVKTADEFVTAAEQHLEPINKSELRHAEEAPRYLRNVLARLRELPKNDRNIWLKGIMGEFDEEFSHVKWRDGYEQGKFDGAVEAEKSNTVVIPQFVADWIEKCKTFKYFAVRLSFALQPSAWEANRLSDECIEWLTDAENQDLFARAWLDGYDVEQEKLYTVEIPDPNADGYSIALGRKEGKVYIRQFVSPTWQMSCSNQLTEAEIKQDFDWAWQWAKPAEVQEVKE